MVCHECHGRRVVTEDGFPVPCLNCLCCGHETCGDGDDRMHDDPEPVAAGCHQEEGG